jgi:hypothetical protein
MKIWNNERNWIKIGALESGFDVVCLVLMEIALKLKESEVLKCFSIKVGALDSGFHALLLVFRLKSLENERIRSVEVFFNQSRCSRLWISCSFTCF